MRHFSDSVQLDVESQWRWHRGVILGVWVTAFRGSGPASIVWPSNLVVSGVHRRWLVHIWLRTFVNQRLNSNNKPIQGRSVFFRDDALAPRGAPISLRRSWIMLFSPVGGPTQTQLSRPMSSGHHNSTWSTDYGGNIWQLNTDTNASNAIFMKGKQKKNKKRKEQEKRRQINEWKQWMRVSPSEVQKIQFSHRKRLIL